MFKQFIGKIKFPGPGSDGGSPCFYGAGAFEASWCSLCNGAVRGKPGRHILPLAPLGATRAAQASLFVTAATWKAQAGAGSYNYPARLGLGHSPLTLGRETLEAQDWELSVTS